MQSNQRAGAPRATMILGTLVVMASCSDANAASAPVSLYVASVPGGTEYQLMPSPGVRINARLLPTIEFDSVSRLSLHSPDVTADSAYFVGQPRGVLVGPPGPLDGSLRVGICRDGRSVCESVLLPLREIVTAR